MSFSLNRRAFALGTAGIALASLLPGRAFAQGETRSVTTSFGTYDIPVAPLRVVAIDSRLDLQPALALGLTVVGYGHSVPGAWVPVDTSAEFVGSEVNVEQVLALDPDLIICSDYDPDSVWWPANKLKEVAPVVPTSNDQPWKDAFRELATLLGREGEGETAFGEYDALIADIKARRAQQIASKTIVNIQAGEGVVYGMNGSKMLVPQVLADLGAKTVAPAEGQDYDIEITPEQFGNVLGAVDGFLLVTSPDDADPLAGLPTDPLWQRVPAVANAAILPSKGNINYGSIYSAIYIAKMVDELCGKLT
jgi:iron complex transport system substrate-binding protein